VIERYTNVAVTTNTTNFGFLSKPTFLGIKGNDFVMNDSAPGRLQDVRQDIAWQRRTQLFAYVP